MRFGVAEGTATALAHLGHRAFGHGRFGHGFALRQSKVGFWCWFMVGDQLCGKGVCASGAGGSA